MSEIVGAVLAVATVSRKLRLAISAPSLTVTVIVAEPVRPEAGVTIRVRFAPESPKRMLLKGTRVGLEQLALKVRSPGAVSSSPTVKGIGPTAVPVKVNWSGSAEMVGG